MPPLNSGISLNVPTESVHKANTRALYVAVTLGLVLLFFFGWAWRARGQMQARQMQRRNSGSETPIPASAARRALEQEWGGKNQKGTTGSQPGKDAAAMEPPPLEIAHRNDAQQSQPMGPPAPTAEEIAAQKEQAAMESDIVPSRNGQGAAAGLPTTSPSPGNAFASNPDLSQLKNMLGKETAGTAGSEYEEQNGLTDKKNFAGSQGKGPILVSKTPVEFPCTVRSGWDIPAILEQSADSDLPGNLRARVRLNVYDSDNGKCLAIPQNSILVGHYNSNVSYAQDRMQVKWDRIVMADTHQAINLDGMSGADADGGAGLTGKVNNHFKRLIGFALLSSAFAAGIEVSQQRSSSNAYGYPSSGQVVGQAVGQELGEFGRKITARNLNRQPTIKLLPGTRFNVRVDRDMVFSE